MYTINPAIGGTTAVAWREPVDVALPAHRGDDTPLQNITPRLPQVPIPKRGGPSLSVRLFRIAGYLGLGCTAALLATLWYAPQIGLTILWGLLIPVVPFVLFTAPALWRNVCPIATLNQLPRRGGFSLALPAPKVLERWGFLVAILLLFGMVGARRFLFDSQGQILALVVGAVLTLAFVQGVLFRGKSGWCNGLCPVGPVGQLYGRGAFAKLPNAHCTSCIGCSRNCFDGDPSEAHLKDLYDDDEQRMRLRRYFAAVFPGFVYAFYVVPSPPDIGIAQMYLAFAGWMAVSLAAFATLEAITTLSLGFLTSLFAVLALNLYYFFNAPEFAHNLTLLAGLKTVPEWTRWTVLGFQGLLGVASAIWLWRVARRDSTYRRLRERRLAMAASGTVAIQFAGTEQPANVKPGSTLLEAAESLGLAVGASCRQGDCGADLVCVLNGAENLEPPAEKERTTLARLGAEADQRLACCARILGPVTVAYAGNAQSVDRVDDALRARVDASVEQVVVIGNGITGSTALERIAALSPDCRLTLIGDEPRGFYNRMGIAQLIETGDAGDALSYPHPSALAERPVDRRINTLVRAIDPAAREVVLGTGERIGYDRLLLATGAAAARPPLPGAKLAGCFDLRTAADAIAIRGWLQRMSKHRAVVIGAGVLGLEAAEALARFGVPVDVLETGPNLMPLQLLPATAAVVAAALSRHGVQVHAGVQVAAIHQAMDNKDRVGAVELANGEMIPAGLVLFCTGNRPNIALAQDAGLSCGRGIRVDASMRTSDPHIYAAGDVAELEGCVTGLWEPARRQALAAADSMLGLERIWQPEPLAVRGKLKSVNLVTLGTLPPPSERHAKIVVSAERGAVCRQLILDRNGMIASAAFVNAPLWIGEIETAMRNGQDLRPLSGALREGHWEILRAPHSVAA